MADFNNGREICLTKSVTYMPIMQSVKNLCQQFFNIQNVTLEHKVQLFIVDITEIPLDMSTSNTTVYMECCTHVYML